MDDNDWIFSKLPSWLRWILALPVAIVGCLLFPIISSFSLHLVVGWDSNGILIQSTVMLASISGFILGLFYCVPKHKVVIASVACILLAIYFSIIIAVLCMQGYTWTDENIVNGISVTVCVFMGIKLLLSKDEIDTITSDNKTINL